MQKKIETVKTLLEALPFIKQFANQKIVIKYGGSAQTSPQLKEQFAEDILLSILWESVQSSYMAEERASQICLML